MQEKTQFKDLNLSQTTLDAISKKNFKFATRIQEKVIPIIFENKYDIIGIAQTGCGKTAAFGLPLIDMINLQNKFAKSIILAPTRELALQVTSEIQNFCGKKKLNILTVYGGSPILSQIKALKKGVDIVVGTPGRVVDLLKRGDLVLKNAEYFVLDEADEMLKMGFIEDIEFILDSSSKSKKVYLFSATMPNRIKELSKKYMQNQKIIEVKKKLETSNLITQSFYKAKQSEKFFVLEKIIKLENFFYGIIFCRTKADVENITVSLKKLKYDVDCIHGDIIQNKRERILNKFKEQKINILVATDVAARGIDIADLSHVINFNLPEDVMTYTHRIGRTGRAKKKGQAISLVSPSEIRKISFFEKSLKTKIEFKKLPSKQEIEQILDEKYFLEIQKKLEYIKNKKKDLKQYLNLYEKLIENFDKKELILMFLEKNYKKDKEQIKDNKIKKEQKVQKNSRNSKNLRLFIAKGRYDKMNKKGLIHFLEKETRLKLNDARDVKVCEKFSFLTINENKAHKIVEFFESINSKKPLVEIAKK